MNLRMMTAVGACMLVMAAGAEATDLPVQGGKLIVDHPADWKASISGPAIGPTLRLAPKGADGFTILITAIVPRSALPTDAALADMLRAEGAAHLATATQTKIDLQPVKGAQARGYVYHLTDRSPEKGPGDFKELRRGTVVVGPLLVTVTVLTHTADQATVDAALAAVTNARYQPTK
jgi:hypothetical protein